MIKLKQNFERPIHTAHKYLDCGNEVVHRCRLFFFSQEKLIHCLKGRGSSCELTCMEYNHNGNLLVAGDYQGRITLYGKSYLSIFQLALCKT